MSNHKFYCFCKLECILFLDGENWESKRIQNAHSVSSICFHVPPILLEVMIMFYDIYMLNKKCWFYQDMHVQAQLEF